MSGQDGDVNLSTGDRAPGGGHDAQFDSGEVRFAPDEGFEVHPLPDEGFEVHPLPDEGVEVLPLPGEGDDVQPIRPIPPVVTPEDDEIRIALERARLVASDLESVFREVRGALRDGAWVSRRADDFSLELDDNIRHLGMIGERAIEAIEELAQRGRPDRDVDALPGTSPGGTLPYTNGSFG